jgi:uncharacterized protein
MMVMDHFIENPFHAGERAAQTRAGFVPRFAAIRDRMPEQHRLFFAALPFVVAATIDGEGWPVATVLSGGPGFIASPDDATLRIGALPDDGDPAASWLKPGAPIGLLGIDLATRRRNRANGVIAGVDSALTVAVKESFGNCPQYIHVRDITARATAASATEALSGLDEPARDAIAAADTLFVATLGPGDSLDISHRAGAPGFVRVDGDVLTIPDYRGNRYFNTLGNMMLNPSAALLFPDFTSGDLLQVQGRTEIVWDVPESERLPGAERLWRLHVTRGWRRRGALPLHWTLRG